MKDQSYTIEDSKCVEVDWPTGRDPKAYMPLDFMAVTPNATISKTVGKQEYLTDEIDFKNRVGEIVK